MVSSISSDDNDTIKLMMQQMLQKMNSADTDGTAGLSKSELASVDTSGDAGGASFIKSLTEQFDSLDTDGNGELSSAEISSATPPSEPMGPPPGMSIASDDDSSDSSSVSSAKTIAGSVSKEDSSSSASTAVSKDSDTDSLTTDSVASLGEALLKKLLENFSDSFDKSSTSANEKAKKVASEIKTVMSAEKDGENGVSKEDLSSIDTSKDPQLADMVKDLMQNFDSYDSNSDGQLSLDEVKSAVSHKLEFSKKEIAALNQALNPDSSQSSDSSSFSSDNLLGGSSEAFVQKLISSYKSFSDVASGLSAAASAV